MSCYRFFIGSSIVEYSLERDIINNLLVTLGRLAGIKTDIFICEHCNKFIRPQGKQEEYNEALRASDIAIFIFGAKVGSFTLDEVKCALDSQCVNGKPEIVVLFDGSKTPRIEPEQERNRNELEQLIGSNPDKIRAIRSVDFYNLQIDLLDSLSKTLSFDFRLSDGRLCVNGRPVYIRRSAG